MINPRDLAALIVADLWNIPGVRSEMNSDSTAVAAYDDAFPASVNLMDAIAKVRNPGILVVWNGSGPGRAPEVWTHRFSLILRAKNRYADLFAVVANGIPDGQSLNFRRKLIHLSCSPISFMDCNRRTLFVTDQASIDYYEANFSIGERGISA